MGNSWSMKILQRSPNEKQNKTKGTVLIEWEGWFCHLAPVVTSEEISKEKSQKAVDLSHTPSVSR